MLLTPYHARYFALLLTRRTVGVERYLPALASSGIDLHPHQIDAAVFATRSPFRDGVILADEEGLGKTIEAGIVALQSTLEGRNRILVLCPPALTNHWRTELADKFSLATVGLDAAKQDGGTVVMSFQKAAREAEHLRTVTWDLCILDEAHHLANASLGEHTQSTAIREALSGRPKLLVTATPMQNSLLDLYYLVSFVDDTIFVSDPEAFRARYTAKRNQRHELASRAQMICQRTLRRQALTMPRIQRTVKTFLVHPSPEETELSRRMSLFFHREHLAAFPKVKEHNIRLTYWKMLASSPRTLAESLRRVETRLANIPEADEERRELGELAAQAAALPHGTRVTAFLDALDAAMVELRKAGAPEKAVVFSEHRTTLDFLHTLLSEHGYDEKIVACYGGSTSKKALTEFALGGKRILLATDGGATGLDLSHCALVINYDLPWNVQKLEQRISRCHRYGQQHDVRVINFIDPTNRADRRLYDSLNKKLRKFDDIFGASETVLGVVTGDSDLTGFDRDKTTVTAERQAVMKDAADEIQLRVGKAEADILAHFDEEVQERFRRYGEKVAVALSRMDDWLWYITRHRLRTAVFKEEERSFILDRSPYPFLRLKSMFFHMGRSPKAGSVRYHLGHPLARHVLADCLEGGLQRGEITIRATTRFPVGLSGVIALWNVGMASEHVYRSEAVLCGISDDGRALAHDECAALMKLEPLACVGGREWNDQPVETYHGRAWRGGRQESRPLVIDPRLVELRDAAFTALRERFTSENDDLLREELDRLRQWGEDEEAALLARQEDLLRRNADAKGKAANTAGFVQRFRQNQQAATLERQRQQDEERLGKLKAEIVRKRDERMEAARKRAEARFWSEEMYAVRFRVEVSV